MMGRVENDDLPVIVAVTYGDGQVDMQAAFRNRYRHHDPQPDQQAHSAVFSGQWERFFMSG